MLVLAPMQGLTGLPFRRAYYRTFGDVFDYAISPFISLTHGNLSLADKKISDVLPENNVGSMPVVPQVLGSETQEFVDLANRLYDVGYSEVNWNLGCPMPRVAKKKRGSGLLPFPEKVEEVLDALTTKTSISVSVKMRLGYTSDKEILDLVPVLNHFPLVNVAIHPRIGTDLYQGDLHLQPLHEVLSRLRHKVIFNGDINNPNDVAMVRKEFPGIQDFMIGRGAVSDPLLAVKLVRGENVFDKCRIITFMNNLYEEIDKLRIPGKSKANKLKEYWGMMCCGFARDYQGKEKPLYCESPRKVWDSAMEIVAAQ
ncbi:MAG: tRNA-dihydrouridine synthase family protein [Bacteroidales bacterium]|nr:tRNA-dihydrouridine synthase family protein [Bacteroidales bacterium]